MKQLTLSRLKNTPFIKLYRKIVLKEDLTSFEYKKLLSLAVIFINQKDRDLKHLGYRIIVFYCNKTQDYIPLYDIAINSGLIPINKFIERLDSYHYKFENNFFKLFSSSFMEIFKRDNIYLSEGQQDLYSFFMEKKDETISIVAPTSYGKSELIISTLKNKGNKNVCILVPTKALLAQTKRRIINANIKNVTKIITHPEMYLESDKHITAVLTQERLLRLLQKNPSLSFDIVFVDEAHNLLENDSRSVLLATAIVILEKRNSNVTFKFLTPFLEDSSNLAVQFTSYSTSPYKIEEYIKTERFFLCDFKKDKKLKLYDQFLNEYFELDGINYIDDISLILREKLNKNIIYLNKPFDIEDFSIKLAEKQDNVVSERIKKACAELSNHFHNDYTLIDCLKKGIIYHHGSIPENVRLYIEQLYSSENSIKFIITSSTLLEGVNIPAERLFILDNKKGRGNLSTSQFRNLTGRICRFNEIFSKENNDLLKLEPCIYLIASNYSSKNANIDKFISDCMKVDKEVPEKPNNVLLKSVEINRENRAERNDAEEFIENFENEVIPNYERRHAKTQIGKLCYANNITEIDIISQETKMQNIVETKRKSLFPEFDSSNDILSLISDIFLPFIKNDPKYRNIQRLKYLEAQRFYSMFLDWRIKNAAYSEMISSFLRYWRMLESRGLETLVYVGKWGDESREGFQNLWTDIRKKNMKQRVNLAIVRIKDEQDFLDNILIKFIEVLNDLGFLDSDFYEKIKYGTSDKFKIALIKNGFSIGLANLLVDKYIDLLEINIANTTVKIDSTLIKEMEENGENEIFVFEARYNTKENIEQF